MEEYDQGVYGPVWNYGAGGEDDRWWNDTVLQNVIQDDQLEQLTTQAREAEAQLTTLKTSLQTMPLMVQITHFKELKDLQQWAT